ncbi:MAG: hypothetical protein QM296_02075, partial [Bacillota bacterium]|nr:hypothetical protein [Bacillota bacterium]
MNRLNNALNSIFKFFPTILIRDFRVSNRSSRYYRLFNRCWITAALFTPVLSTLLLTFLNEKTYIVTVFALLSNILTWPLFFSYIFKKLIVFMKQLKIEV